MKLGLDAIVTDALKELAAADHAYMAAIRSGDEGPRHQLYNRLDAAKERVLNLAKGLFPAPPCAPKRASKPRAATGSIVRAANDAGRARPRALPAPRALPPAPRPAVEITIVDDQPRQGPSLLLFNEGSRK